MRYFVIEASDLLEESAFYFRTIDCRQSSAFTRSSCSTVYEEMNLHMCGIFHASALRGGEEREEQNRCCHVFCKTGQREKEFQSLTCFMLKRFSALSPKLQRPSIQICLISLSKNLILNPFVTQKLLSEETWIQVKKRECQKVHLAK